MTTHQENKLSMYLTVMQITNYFPEAWQGYLPFRNQYSEFETLVDKIRAIRPLQETKITGVTKDKTALRYKAVDKAIEISEKVFAFASITENYKLKDRVAYTTTDLKRCRDTVANDFNQIIYTEASKYLNELAEYGVSQEDLDELKTLNDAYSAIVANPRQAITNRPKTTSYPNNYFKDADIILKERLDKLVNYFKNSSPDFWHQFKSARKIIDLGYRRKKKEEEAPAAG